MAKNYYLVLGVDRGASPGQIKQAYRRIVKQLHPDLAPASMSADRFIEVQEAYDTLADAVKRSRYDAELQSEGSPPRVRRVAHIVRDRRRTYGGFEQLESFVDEFFEGFLPGFYSHPRGRPPEKDIYLEVVLSSRESREGGLFPIRFPVLEPCPRCGRAGILDEFFCPACFGRGSVSSEREFALSIPPRTGHGTAVTLSLEDIGLRDVQLHVEIHVDPQLED
ncbi:MAG: DnaJ domain-containing protein [Hyphomicrobiales bacterium]